MQKNKEIIVSGFIGIIIGFALGFTYARKQLRKQIIQQNEKIEILSSQIFIQNQNKGIQIAKDLQNRMKKLKETLKVADAIVNQLEINLQNQPSE